MRFFAAAMHPVKRILGHLYFGYAILVFAATMLVVVLPVWIISLQPEPRQSRWLHPVFKAWMSVYLPLVFVLVRRKGRDHFKKGSSYVVVCNHNSFADVPVSSPWIPGPNKTLAKSEMARIPLFGLIYKAGSILVNRKNESSRRDSFTKMQAVLEQGTHLCLYPEGTRNKSGAPMQPFYDGAFITAIRTQRPVIPAVIFNTRFILPNRPKFWAWPMPIPIHFLPPVETIGLSLRDAAMLKDKVREQMIAYFVANGGKVD